MKNFLTFLILLFTISCSSNKDIQYGAGGAVVKNDFQINEIFKITLSDKYFRFGQMKASIGDEKDAQYFQKKGKSVLKGDYIAPEKLSDRNIEEKDFVTIDQAHTFLLQSINQNTMVNKPEKLADTIFFFDCWLELQEEKTNPESINFCRESFYQNLDELYLVEPEQYATYQLKYDNNIVDDYQYSSFTPTQSEPKKYSQKDNVIKCEKSVCISSDEKVLYFPFDEDILTYEARDAIKQISQRILQSGRQYSITLNGYADRAGSEEYNIKLSKERSLVVKNELIRNGIDRNLITIFAFGEMQAMIQTTDGMIEHENRSVELVIEIY